MKIAFVTTADPFDVFAWSGTVSYMYQALKAAGHEMIPVGNLKNPYVLPIKIIRKLIKIFSGKVYLGERESLVLKSYARQIKRRLRGGDYDIIFSHLPIPIAELRTSKPIFFFADANFAEMIGFYDSFSGLSKRTISLGIRHDKLALARSKLGIYSSEWAAETACANYGVGNDRVAVVPLGANIECNRTQKDIDEIIRNKSRGSCELLLLGVNWVRKGGDLAVAVAEELNRRGIETILHVVGCQPNKPVPDFV
ncbi:MAG: glycosyltransferase, partial [Kiritimatiellaeota bacterium]|nr:glycosyltransferase [Kiritimatiellota bacterium]